MRALLIILALLGIGLARADPSLYQPEEAIEAARAAAPDGVVGEFALVVRGVGEAKGRVFLNSSPDYRDPRSLNVALDGPLVERLTAVLGAPPQVALKGRPICVTGEARQARIHFMDGAGRPTGRYYFQTHVRASKVRPHDCQDVPIG